ncbi:uncharacterized protein LOC119720689 [Patiria miniata]|uniref:Uncharacterized protein n=1 Tax=Patiria miniata TaxID=46514 RepID=A0A913Z6I0_PATMI|nr:uncharacterized protein LOC119720689 [Patiria miniata]
MELLNIRGEQNNPTMAGREELYSSSVSTEETPLMSSSRLMNQDGYPRKMQPWPRPLTVALCILGIWRPGTAQRATRNLQAGKRVGHGPLPRVYSHQPGGPRVVDSNGNTVGMSGADSSGEGLVAVTRDGGDQDDLPPLSWSQSVGSEECRLDDTQCDICYSNSEALYDLKTTDSDGKMKKLFYNGVMLLYLVTLTGFMTYDFVAYFEVFWGNVTNVLILVSYFTYLFQVIVVPVFVLLTRFMDWFHLMDKDCTWVALHSDFIFQRSQYLRHGSGAASFLSLGLFLTWPIINGVLRIIYDRVYRPGWNSHAFLSRWCAMASYIVYGSFCYLVYAQRRSLQKEFRVVAHFVASNAPKGSVVMDVCRDRLSRMYHQYHIMRDFVGIWMAFSMAVATWGLTAHLTWNYVIFSYCQTKDLDGLPVLNLLIWSQKIMFFVLPSLAVGGINIDYMWRHFRYILANHGRHRYSTFWHAIMKHVSRINLLGQGLSATLVFSALGLYLGLSLGDSAQNVAFWNGPGEFNVSIHCNFTSHKLH